MMSIIANLCSIRSHFNALDFSECRSEEERSVNECGDTY